MTVRQSPEQDEGSKVARCARRPHDRVARTGTALVLLRTLHAADHRLWRRAEQKAARYLQGALGADVTAVTQWVRSLEVKLASAAPSAASQ